MFTNFELTSTAKGPCLTFLYNGKKRQTYSKSIKDIGKRLSLTPEEYKSLFTSYKNYLEKKYEETIPLGHVIENFDNISCVDIEADLEIYSDWKVSSFNFGSNGISFYFKYSDRPALHFQVGNEKELAFSIARFIGHPEGSVANDNFINLIYHQLDQFISKEFPDGFDELMDLDDYKPLALKIKERLSKKREAATQVQGTNKPNTRQHVERLEWGPTGNILVKFVAQNQPIPFTSFMDINNYVHNNYRAEFVERVNREGIEAFSELMKQTYGDVIQQITPSGQVIFSDGTSSTLDAYNGWKAIKDVSYAKWGANKEKESKPKAAAGTQTKKKDDTAKVNDFIVEPISLDNFFHKLFGMPVEEIMNQNTAAQQKNTNNAASTPEGQNVPPQAPEPSVEEKAAAEQAAAVKALMEGLKVTEKEAKKLLLNKEKKDKAARKEAELADLKEQEKAHQDAGKDLKKRRKELKPEPTLNIPPTAQKFTIAAMFMFMLHMVYKVAVLQFQKKKFAAEQKQAEEQQTQTTTRVVYALPAAGHSSKKETSQQKTATKQKVAQKVKQKVAVAR